LALSCRRNSVGEASTVSRIAVGIHIIAGTTLCPAGREGVVKVLRKLGNLERIRSERSLTVEELSKASGVPRNTIVGLEEGTRKAQKVTVTRLAEVLGVEPDELANEEGVTILEEREGDRVRVVKQYDDYTLEMSYDTSNLDEAYRLILEGWDGWEEFRRRMPTLEERFGREWVVEFLSRVVQARLTGQKFVPPEPPRND
jgi:transcriptional regulator with XRE-family HTH domain